MFIRKLILKNENFFSKENDYHERRFTSEVDNSFLYGEIKPYGNSNIKQNITAVVGGNGVGKTTYLNKIENALSNNRRKKTLNFDYEIEYDCAYHNSEGAKPLVINSKMPKNTNYLHVFISHKEINEEKKTKMWEFEHLKYKLINSFREEKIIQELFYTKKVPIEYSIKLEGVYSLKNITENNLKDIFKSKLIENILKGIHLYITLINDTKIITHTSTNFSEFQNDFILKYSSKFNYDTLKKIKPSNENYIAFLEKIFIEYENNIEEINNILENHNLKFNWDLTKLDITIDINNNDIFKYINNIIAIINLINIKEHIEEHIEEYIEEKNSEQIGVKIKEYINYSIERYEKFFRKKMSQITSATKINKFTSSPPLNSGTEYIFDIATYINKNISLVNKKVDSLFLLLDEPTAFLHPERQRNLVRYLMELIPLYLKDIKSIKNFHYIITTHSPIVLTDIPGSNIVYLGKENPTIETFGQDIYRLYFDEFYLKKQFGYFSDKFISKINKDIKEFEHDENDCKKNDIMERIEFIGNEVLKNILKKKLNEKINSLKLVSEKEYKEFLEWRNNVNK